jgi:hypothetical protein
VNLYITTKNLNNTDNIQYLGCIVRQDFIDMSSSIEKMAFQFYSKKVFKLNIENKKKWHKYEKEVTSKRLDETHLKKYDHYISKL